MPDKEVVDYLEAQRVGVLAVEMLDSSPHAATVHFAHTANPFIFYFETNREYRKAEPILKNTRTRASLVVGSSEDDMKTFQTDGFIQILSDNEMKTYLDIYLGKFPEKKEKDNDPKFIRFTFTPEWWRFTDWTTPKGKTILTSVS